MTLGELAARFRGPVKRDARGVTVFCPAHADGQTQNRPSLRLTETPATGGLHVRCWAGCEEAAILAAVSLPVADLAPMRRRNGTERYSVATYDYHLEDGTLAYQVVRYEPKDFRQRRPDGAGGWVWNMAGIRRVPYRLPQLRGAPVVFITEGEKDADALVALGLTATTNTGGAGKWTAADTAALITAGVGAVVVVPDNDPAGEAHAAKVAASCRGAGLEVRIVQLPELGPKEDVSDWLRAPGHTRETIEALVAATAPDHGSTGPAEADAEGASAGTEGEAEPLSDAGNARRFAREHGQDVRYCYALRAWFNWNALRWARDPGEQVAQRAKATARRGLMEALALPEGSARKAAVRHALYTESARGIRAMLELAQSEPGLSIAPEMLDADPWLLTTPAGTLELGAVPRCRPPRREDYITKITAAPYVPGARHPVFDRFLTEMLPDVASRAYVQRAAGYSLTASQAEEVLFLIRGRTAAGKTTLQEALKAALGDYAMAADFETFTAHKDRHGPREDLVRLKGARLVVTSETRERRLDEGMVKRATGGDTLAGRRLFENTVEFTSTFKLWLAGNHRPVVSGDDDAIWRRIREIPFPRSLSPAERDPTVKATLTDPAVGGPAVLAWAVEGCAAWCQRRAAKDPAGALGEPAAVVEATADYREVMDTVAAFLAACCVLESGAWVSRHDLREALEQWGREEGLSGLPSGRTLASGLRERGVLDKGREGRRGWRGVRLRGPADPEPETAEPSETVAPW